VAHTECSAGHTTGAQWISFVQMVETDLWYIFTQMSWFLKTPKSYSQSADQLKVKWMAMN
jgi:hypothetical protein